jgi:hypothetical protein
MLDKQAQEPMPITDRKRSPFIRGGVAVVAAAGLLLAAACASGETPDRTETPVTGVAPDVTSPAVYAPGVDADSPINGPLPPEVIAEVNRPTPITRPS